MKVSELIEVLKSYPVDAEVVAEWDAGLSNIDNHSLEKNDEGCNVVVLDVEDWKSYPHRIE